MGVTLGAPGAPGENTYGFGVTTGGAEGRNTGIGGGGGGG